MEWKAGSRFFLRAHERRRSRVSLIHAVVATLITGSVATFSFAGSAAASTARTLSDFQKPIVVVDQFGVIAYEHDNTTTPQALSNIPNIVDVSMTLNRDMYIATPSTLQRVGPDGVLDSTFALTGTLTGFTAVTHMAIDETSERVYLLNQPPNEDPSIIAVNFAGEVLATAQVPNVVAIAATHGYVAAFTTTLENSTLLSTDLANVATLNLNSSVQSAVGISDADVLPPASLPLDPGAERPFLVALTDSLGNQLMRLEVFDYTTPTPSIVVAPAGNATHVIDIEAPQRSSVTSDGSVVTVLGGSRAGDVVVINPDNTITDTTIGDAHANITAIGIAPAVTKTTSPTNESSSSDNATNNSSEDEPKTSMTALSSEGPTVISGTNVCDVVTSTGPDGSTLLVYTVPSGLSSCTATWTPPEGVTAVDTLIVGGGGGGGGGSTGAGGGGGGGAVQNRRALAVSNTSHTITVGGGGTGGSGGSSSANGGNGSTGASSSAFSVTANGGGGGGGGLTSGQQFTVSGDGGSSGSGISGSSNNWEGAGGGAGAGTIGTPGSDLSGADGAGGNGGFGVRPGWIIGACDSIFGGGGGGGGSGGGRNGDGFNGGGGAATASSNAVAGTDGCGGGGGGGRSYNGTSTTDYRNGARGGNGMIAIRYHIQYSAKSFSTGNTIAVTRGVSSSLGLGTSQVSGYTNNETVRARLSTSTGTLSVSGPSGGTITNSGTADVTIVGTQSQVNAALNTATVTTANSFRSTQITLDIDVNPATQTIGSNTFNYSSTLGRFYVYSSGSIQGGSANTAAQNIVFGARPGFLATITSDTERDFLRGLLPTNGQAWVGATDSATEGSWVWGGEDTWNQFSTGASALTGMWAGWEFGEPNDNGGYGDYAVLVKGSGLMDDLDPTFTRPALFEFEPKSSRTIFNLSYTTTSSATATAGGASNPSLGTSFIPSDKFGSETITTTVSAPSGTSLTISGTPAATTSGQGTNSLTITGSITNVNSTLNALRVNAPSAGTTNLTIAYRPQATDHGSYKYHANTDSYYLIGSTATHSNATTTSRNATFGGVNGFLVTVMNESERSFLLAQTTNAYWVGAKDELNEGQWVMGDNPLDGRDAYETVSHFANTLPGKYTSWSSGEPNNQGQDCVVGNWGAPNYMWDDGACSSTFTTITEFKPYTVSTVVALTVTDAPTVTTPSSGLAITAGTPYSLTLSASGGISPYTWSVASGTLPDGLSLNASTGVISGTVMSRQTDRAITVTATDANNSAVTTNSFTLSTSIATCTQPSSATSGRYTVLTFTNLTLCEFSGLPTGVTSVDALVVGGGGGGGENVGQGGSGGGGYYAGNVPISSSTPLNVRIGAGGLGGAASTSDNSAADSARNGGTGGTTSLSWGATSFSAPGGQGGHTAWSDDKCVGTTWYTTQPAASTGSGTFTGATTAAYTSGRGGLSDSNSSTTNVGSVGGNGFANAISGVSVSYGGGGGGGGWGNTGSAGGTGGGGAGSGSTGVEKIAGQPGTANTGGGGGGGGVGCAAGGNGADGVVLVRYANVPTISIQPANAFIIESTSATLSVTASATGATSGQLSYQWRKDGANISGATASTYTIATAQASSAGSYDVVITNTVSDTAASSVTSSSATVTVGPAPCSPSQSNNGRYIVQKFTNTSSACTFNTLPSHVTSIDVLVVGGGGGSGGSATTSSGGGGGGAVRLVEDVSVVDSDTWTVQVGNGGSGGAGTYGGGTETSGSPGGHSQFGNIVAGGGAGGTRGSLGGTRGVGGTASGTGAYDGGNGGNPSSGAGGTGNTFDITGSSVCYGAGGGGGGNAGASTGGTGGCGIHSSTNQTYRGSAGGNSLTDGIAAQNASNASQNSGDIYRGHGAGGASGSSSGGSGGPGVVYVKYIAKPVVAGPTNVTKEFGQDVTLSVTATAGAITTNGLAYQWRRNGTNVGGATSATLTLSSVDFDDAGQYDVVVTNDDGQGESASTTSTAATVTVEPRIGNFKIKSLAVSTTARTVIDVNYIGDDRGGMAVSGTNVFLNGDNYLGYWPKSLSSYGLTGRYTEVDAIVSDVKAMKAYVFNLGNTSNCAPVTTPCFTQLTEINSTTGVKTANVITLSAPIPYGGPGEIYAGYGRIAYRNGTSNVVYDIEMPSGTVTNAGTRAITRNYSENVNGAAWGVAEYFDGDLWLAYSYNGYIKRTNVRTGLTENIVACNCSDLASFVVDPTTNRWYFHYEYASPAFNTNFNENLGYASAEFETLPNATIAPTTNVTNSSIATFNVSFEDGVTGVATSDFSVSGTSPNWSVSSVTANSTTSYTVTVTQSSPGNGTLLLNLAANSANWTAGGGTALPSNTVTSSAMTVDQTPPTASFTTVPNNYLSSASSTYTVTFNEAISGLAAEDFSNAGTAQNCVITPAATSGTAINITVASCGDGTLDLQLADNSVTDTAGNTGPTSAVTAASRYVDATPGAPVLSFSQNPTSPTNSTTQTFTLTANEPISGLTASDITNVGTAQNCEITVTGTQPGTTFTVTASNCGEGTVQLRLTANSVSDAAGVSGPEIGAGTGANTQVTGLTVAASPYYAALSPDQTRLYFTDAANHIVRVLDTTTNTMLPTTIATGTGPRGIAITSDGSVMYVANRSDNTVSKIRISDGSLLATITTQSFPQGVEITPDGTKIVVGNYGSASLSIIDAATDVVSHHALGVSNVPYNLKISPNSQTVYTSNANTNTVTVFNLTNNTVIQNIAVGSGVHELAINNAGTRVYTANYASDSVSVINTSTNAVIQTITGIVRPTGIRTSADDQTVYVLSNSNRVVKWFSTTTAVVNAGSIPLASTNPWGLTMSSDGSLGYALSIDGGLTVFSTMNFVKSSAITIDRASPTASFTTVPNNYLSSIVSVYTVTFDKAISGLAADDFSNAGTAQNCTFTPASVTGTTINITVTGCGDGTLDLQLAQNAVTDTAGNTGPASAVTAASRYVDGFPGAPDLSFSQNPISPTNSTTQTFTLTANEPISGLSASDITNVGSATDCEIAVTGTQPGTTFTVTADNCSGGTVELQVEPESVVDGADITAPKNGTNLPRSLRTNIVNVGSSRYSAMHPDGTKLYVSVENENYVKVVNTGTNTVTNTISVGAYPLGIATTPDGRFVYVANYNSHTVSKISTATNTSVATISVGTNPIGLAITPDGSKVVVANYSGNSVTIIDTATDTRERTVALGRVVYGVKIAPNGKKAYVTSTGSHSVSIIDLIDASAPPQHFSVGLLPYEIGLNRAGTRLYVSNFGSDTVTVYNTSNHQLLRTLANISKPMGIVTSMDDSTVYVVSYGSQQLRWFGAEDTSFDVGTVAASTNAWSISMLPDGSRAYINNQNNGQLTVVNILGRVRSSVITVDRAAPTALFTAVPSGTLSSASSTYTVTFNEAISGLAAEDFLNAGTAQNCAFTPASATGTTINITVAGCGDGTLELQLTQDAVTDAAGNTGPASAVTAASRYVDGFPGAPTASFTTNPSSPNNSQTLTFQVTFSEPVTGFTSDDLTNIGTATDCQYSINGIQPGTVFTIDVDNCSDGTVMLRINNASVSDRAGNTGPGASGAENSFSATINGFSVNMYSALHPDGSKLYVASENTSRVNVVDTQTNTITHNIVVGNTPRGIAVSRDGNFVYVANYSSNTVSKISTATNTVVATISVGRNPIGLAITPDGTKVIVANLSGSSLSIINTDTNMASSTINLGRSPWNVVVSPDGRTAYTSNYTNSTVSVVNLTNNTITRHISVGSSPYELGINNAGSHVYVSNYSSSSVSVINTDTNQVIRTVTGITRPMGITTSIDDQTVYVNSYTNNRMYWFDAGTYAINSESIATGSYPWGLTLSNDGARGYVNNRSGSSVTVFNAQGFVQSQTVTRDVNAPTLTTFSANTNSPNDLTEQSWTLTFSENVTDLTAADFVVGGTSPDWGSITVTGSGSTYTVSVQNASPTAGTVSVQLLANSVSDASGNTGPSAVTTSPVMRWAVGQGVFKIDSLTTSNVNAVDINATVGDDRGGIALTSERVLVNGDSALGRFDINTLGSPSRVSSQTATWTDAVVTDVKTLKSYAFNLNSSRSGSLTTLTLLDSATGALTSTVTTLSSAIPVSGTSALFSGYSRVAVVTGGKFYDISLPSGQVTNYGNFTMPSRVNSENWATWGVVEYFSGQLHLVYAQNSTTIARVNVATNEISTVANAAAGFSDMASFTVHPRANRWYFRYEGRAGAFNFGSSETVGYANASFNVGGEAPEPVTDVQLSTRSSTAVVTWNAPTAGPTPTDYVLQYSRDGGTSWVWVNDGVSTSTSASVPGFTPGDLVRFRVATVSDVNASPFVASADDMVSPYPTAPTITSISTANASLFVNFTAPSSRGASSISTYQYSLDGGTTWLARTPTSSSSPLVISGLANGTQYSVIIRAVNAQGAGESSNAMSATPFTTPGAPAISSVTPTASGTLTIDFTTPSDDGGSTITNYQYSINNGSTWITRSPASTTTNFTISGLSNGSSYTIIMRAINARGFGTSSAPIVATAGVPASAPTITNVTTGDGSVNVTFLAPSYNGGLPIINYEYSFDGTNWTTRSPASTSSPMTITGLVNGSSYTVRIRAVNLAGVGTSSTTRTGTPSRIPDAPTITAIEPSSQRLRVSVNAPQFDGGTAITNYQYSTNDGLTWTTLNPVNVTGVFTITGLTNAVPYQVRVRAVNARGAGDASATVEGIPATTPGSPTITSITPSPQTLTVSFTAGTTGGAVPNNYEYSTDDGATWTAASPATTVSPLTITGLTNGTTYAVRVRAVNSQGAGGASAVMDATPATTPDAPTISSISGSNGRIAVSITDGFNGGAQITNYQYSTDDGTTWTTRVPAAATSPITISGLTNGTDYDVKIRAINAQGIGAESASQVGRPATVPDAPTIDSLTPDPGQLTATFTAPSFDGGNTVTNYQFSTDGGTTWTTRSPSNTTSPMTITGLEDGTTYAVRIRAVNAQGAGVPSAAIEGVPENVPGAPTITNIVSANQALRVEFSPAAPRGLTVTNYEYSIDNGNNWITPNPVTTQSPILIENLTNGTTYQVKVRGVNSRGSGLESVVVDAIPSTPPGAPTITSVIGGLRQDQSLVGSGTLEIEFTAGTTGGAPITATEYSLDGGTSWSRASQATSPITITGLTNGVTYGVKLRHVNVRGAGVSSQSASGVSSTTPGAPVLRTIRGSDRTLTLYVTAPSVVGGATITNYEYFLDNGEAGTWVALNPQSTAMPIVITEFLAEDGGTPIPLENGATYAATVRAVNANGAGESSETRSAKPSTIPGAPTITSVTGSDGQLSVNFSAPSNNGGEEVTNYQYSTDGGQTWTTRSPMSAESPLAITGLTNGTDHSVKLRGINIQGNGAASNTMVGRPAARPSAPTINSIASDDGSLSVVFSAGFDGGATVTNIEYSTNNGTDWTTPSPTTTSSPLTISGLTNGTVYQVKIRLVNAKGSGAESAATVATPATVPGTPTIANVAPSDGSLTLTVTAPSSNGGAQITAYEYSTNNGETWTDTGSSNTTITAGSLVNGSEYQLKVRAVNRMGAGAASNVVSGTPSRVADAPTISAISAGNQKLTVVFTQGFNGGNETTNVQYSVDNGQTWNTRSAASTTSPIVIAGLTNGTTYDVKLRMVNDRGNGAASATVLGTPGTTPSAPTISSIAVENRKLTVFVTAPSDNGGSNISNYEYSIDDGASWTEENSAVGTGAFDIDPLTNGTSYSVTIRAVNTYGSGASSTPVSATPATTPSMPVILSSTPLNEAISLGFALGPSGGSTITNIEYSIDNGVTWTTRSPSSITSPLLIENLQNGVTYDIKVRAVNARGSGTASRTSGTPATTPGAPVITRIAPRDSSLVVEFEPPEDNGGALVTNYEYSLNNGSWVTRSPISDSSPMIITGLTNGTSYSVRMRAVNDQGPGETSNALMQSPARVPDAPTIAGSTVADSEINIGYSIGNDGGRTVSAIDYSLDDGESWTTVLAATSPITVQNLTNGTTYSVKLRARNELGTGPTSSASSLTPARAPDAPSISSITRGDTTLTVAYTLGGDGGNAINDVEYTINNGVTWLNQPSPSAQSPLRIQGLTNGVSYTVKIRAVNSQGGGADSLAATGMPAGAPSAPTLTALLRGNGSASVAFTLGSDNGAPASNVQYSVNNGTTWVTRSPASVTSPLEITGLVNGTAYNVRVRSVNAMGISTASNSSSVTPAAPPAAPTITAAVGEDSRAVVSFVPNGDGGDPVTNYAYSTDDGVNWTVLNPQTTQSPIVIPGLTNGTEYNIRVRAINSVSESVDSQAVRTTPSGPPLAPTITAVDGSNETLTISFNPGGNGGVPITGYQISTDGGFTWTNAVGTTSPVSISGLTNGAQYSVALRAQNSRGTGTTSATATGIPATVPDAPQITEVISDDGAVHLAISFGGNGGNAINNIEYSIDNGSTWTTPSPASTSRPLTIGNLTNGTTYNVRVRTVNNIGASDPSDMVTALPATTPDAPTVLSKTSGNGTLLVNFTAPISNGGAPITHYQYSIDGGGTWVDTPGATSPIEISNVTVGTAYEVDLRAVNFRGAGADTQSAAKLVTAPPAPPTITTTEIGDGEIALRYAPPTDTGGTTIDAYYYSIDGGENWDMATQQVVAPSTLSAASVSIQRLSPRSREAMRSLSSNVSSVQELRITGLTNGVTYNVTVRAAHSEALGLPSSSFRLVPSTTPGVVRNVEAQSSDQALTISYDAPADNGGRTISGYEFTLDGGITWLDVPENPFMIAGLENGQEYDVRVRALNGNGSGIESSSLLAVPSTTASAPGTLSATAGIRSVELSWTAPEDNGGSPISDYVIQYSTNDGATWQDVDDTVSTATSVLVTSLTGGQTYRFRVIPINLAGRGAPSDSSDPITPASPAAIIEEQESTPIATPIKDSTTKRKPANQSEDDSDSNGSGGSEDAIGDDDATSDNESATDNPNIPSTPDESLVSNTKDVSQNLVTALAVGMAIIGLIGIAGLGIAGAAFNAGPVAVIIRRVRLRYLKMFKKR